MKQLSLAGIGAIAMLSMGAANAADLTHRQAMPVKAPAPVYYPAPYNWTGFYVGINGGGGWGPSNWSNADGSGNFDLSGGLVGGTVGYNWQLSQMVFGLEGDIDWSHLHGSTASALCAGGSCDTRNNYFGTARGRIGYAFDRFMPFITGGLAVGDLKTEAGNGASATDTRVGWTVGGGLEFAMTGPWTAKVEYLYTDLGSKSCELGICNAGSATDVDFHANIVRAGLNYRF